MILRRFKFYSDRMNEEILEQREFNSKSQKKMRRYYDFKIGDKRLMNVTPGSAEEAYLYGKANYPGEVVKSAYIDGKGNSHILTDYRPGVTKEVADRLAENVNKMRDADPKRFIFHRGLVAGRDSQKSAKINYAEDMSNVNHRINARSMGISSLKEEASKLAKIKEYNKFSNKFKRGTKSVLKSLGSSVKKL